jgi:methionine sulfoxide reductase heme-binding subunit
VLVPAARLAWQLATGEFGILPIALNGLTFWSGVWATLVLLLALTVTPALTILRWRALIDVRRIVGVVALAYTIAHMVIWFAMRSWNAAQIIDEMLTRLTLVVATLSTIGLIVLGATSLDAAIRAMGPRGWQRLHNTNFVITGLAILHVVLARGTYWEQYLLAGLFFWLMAWRVLDRYGFGTDARALVVLALGSGLFTALLEAGFVLARRGHTVASTLGYNFNPAMLEVGVPPPWQALAFGLAFALAAALRKALRAKPAPLPARQPG